MNEFSRDLSFSRRMHQRFFHNLYRKVGYEGRFVSVDKSRCSLLIQQRMDVDVMVQRAVNASIAVEEKCERQPSKYGCFSLETASCSIRGRESKGWMHYGDADYLLIGFCQTAKPVVDHRFNERDIMGIHVYLMPFQELKEWFWKNKNYERFMLFTNWQLNRSKFRLAPIEEVGQHVGWAHYWVTEHDATLIERRKPDNGPRPPATVARPITLEELRLSQQKQASQNTKAA